MTLHSWFFQSNQDFLSKFVIKSTMSSIPWRDTFIILINIDISSENGYELVGYFKIQYLIYTHSHRKNWVPIWIYLINCNYQTMCFYLNEGLSLKSTISREYIPNITPFSLISHEKYPSQNGSLWLNGGEMTGAGVVVITSGKISWKISRASIPV